MYIEKRDEKFVSVFNTVFNGIIAYSYKTGLSGCDYIIETYGLSPERTIHNYRKLAQRSEGHLLMSGIRICATGQGRFFTSKNPEQGF